MRRRPIAAVVALAAAAIVSATPADARLAGPVVSSSSSRAAFWHTISGWAPPGSSLTVEVEWTAGAATSGTVGYVFARIGGMPDTGAGLMAASLPNGRYATATISTPGSHLRSLRAGAKQSPGVEGRLSIRTALAVPDGGGRFDLAIFVAANGPVLRQRVKAAFPPGGAVRAESRGSGSLARREHDFPGPVVLEAGDTIPVVSATGAAAVRGSALGSTAAIFRRRPITVFASFAGAGAGGAGSWQGGIPSLLTIEAPDRTTTAPDQIVRAGPAGPYRFRLDAFAAPFVGAKEDTTGLLTGAGKPPLVILAVVDADFPACTTARVRARARDGHPVCGP